MIIDGEKYACEACVRGHRVSNCQHSDRPLQHINKKGRPVSQCMHCRTLRKSRSAHVRCECGEKAHTKSSCTHDSLDLNPDTCCCSHGARCSCALKKEPLDTVPESSMDEGLATAGLANTHRRPRALTAQSEGGRTILSNGLHKAAPKNKMAHRSGLPYVVPRANSIPSGLPIRSMDGLQGNSTFETLPSDSLAQEPATMAQQQQRLVKSEQGSPIASLPSNLDQLNSELLPLDISSMDQECNYFPMLSDSELALCAPELSATPIDWSKYPGLDFNSDSRPFATFSQAPSFTGFDFNSMDQPGLATTSTSGELSEVEDFGHLSDIGAPGPAIMGASSGFDFDAGNSEFGDFDGYCLSATSSYAGPPHAHIPTHGTIEGFNLDASAKALSRPSYESYPSNGLPTSFDDSYGTVTSSQPQEPQQFEDSQAFHFANHDEDDNERFWLNNFANTNDIAPTEDLNSIFHEQTPWAQ